MTHKRDAFVNGLSRGVKQRLCLAKTLVHNPPVLILDEPASGLDPRARVEIKALLKELRSMGKTILISSHILTELADCCTSIGIIERGHLLVHGPMADVYGRIRGHRQVQIRFVEGRDLALKILDGRPDCRNVLEEDASSDRRGRYGRCRARRAVAVAADARNLHSQLRRKGPYPGGRVHDGHQGPGFLIESRGRPGKVNRPTDVTWNSIPGA